MKKSPNILIIVCDQLSPRAIGAYGGEYGCTPNIDKIAETGVKFGRAYTTCPLCQPSRASFWTSRLPHETRVIHNGGEPQNGPLPSDIQTLGDIFARNGYEAIHFGKRHDFGTLRGFHLVETTEKPYATPVYPAWPENLDSLYDNAVAEQCVAWLSEEHERPFIVVADLNNPHNICEWVGQHDGRNGPIRNLPVSEDLPELPDNFEVYEWHRLPLPIRYLCCSHWRPAQAAQWTELNYRHYIAAYCHYAGVVDQHVGQIVDTFYSNSVYEDTLVVILSDHGDGLASHRAVTKDVSFYDATTNVPFIFAGGGVVGRTRILNEPLVSLLDLLPTLSEFSCLECPEEVRGKSLMGFLKGNDAMEHHDYVVSEWHSEAGFTVSPGRMIRTDRYKYTKYLEGNGEELYDMNVDPGETMSLIGNPECEQALSEHRCLLHRHLKATNDSFEALRVKVDKRWRLHECGYQNHRGISAFEEGKASRAAERAARTAGRYLTNGIGKCTNTTDDRTLADTRSCHSR